MAKKKSKFKYDPEWAKAKKLCRLNIQDIRMAKELGISPRSLMKNNSSKSQSWKLPVKLWIRELYVKMEARRAQKQARKAAQQEPRDNRSGMGSAADSSMPEAKPEEMMELVAAATDDGIPF